jgi:hypothetical protein
MNYKEGNTIINMIVHIALFRWKKGTSEKKAAGTLKQVEAIQKKVSGIVSIHTGKNYHHESKGFTQGVVVIAKTQKALDAYRKHPIHQKLAPKIMKMEADGIGFDFQS